MARKKATDKKSTTTPAKSNAPKKSITKANLNLNQKQRLVIGGLFITVGLMVLVSICSYFFTWQADQSHYGNFARETENQNLLKTVGTFIGHTLVYKGFGIASFIFPVLLILTGCSYFLNYGTKQLKSRWFWGIYLTLLFSLFFGFFNKIYGLLSGIVGFEINDLLQDYIGKTGAILVFCFLTLLYLIVRLNLTPEKISLYFAKTKNKVSEEIKEATEVESSPKPVIPTSKFQEEVGIDDFVPVKNKLSESELEIELPVSETELEKVLEPTKPIEQTNNLKSTALEIEIPQEEEGLDIEVGDVYEEEVSKVSKQLVEDFGEFDPTLELGNYKFPTIELLKDYTNGQNSITIDQGELEENKNKIVDTLKNYKIEIAHIKATVGPTVTLYEIIPEAGIRISKIKNLEDDIALSLAALGIRIIAPIPGKGTIGIEVPNKKSTIVSMRSAITSSKFQNAEMELPISFGKTISNETFVVDLAKMPHLLMAGATGQGKSVGLNAILTSLLYKKHPAEVKFVLVDPKKVELTLFNKIERHFLAKLPDSEEAIITDNAKVINTLNSLCIEMDERYDLLKNAFVRNLKEYNTKFKQRKLNPENGHRYLPYIVLVIDEFADLIMTAGKEVEVPIARLAQLARAIGIHLIVATQRPSVNVITGMIKANFPARLAFRVMSKIDSRTILDAGGADQLIGRGDMLYTNGNNLVRVQCAFVDTPEVERITNYIGAQKAYPDAHLLPEYIGEEGGTTLDIDKSERDKLFKEAAEVLVTAQQGSASLLQRKLKLGYNRAGRLIDQLEAAGVVGPFEGSKARLVLIPDLVELEKFLSNE